MAPWHPTVDKILSVLSDGKPRTSKEISDETRLTQPSVWRGILRCWEKGLVLRSEKPIFEVSEKLRGRLGYRRNTSSFYYYVVNPQR